jgi:hypothetical protein
MPMMIIMRLRGQPVTLDNVAALRTALDRVFTRHSQPHDHVRVGGVAGAACVLLVAGKDGNDDGIVEGAYRDNINSRSYSSIPIRDVGVKHITYPSSKNPKASCQKCQSPASFLESQDVPDRWLARDR